MQHSNSLAARRSLGLCWKERMLIGHQAVLEHCISAPCSDALYAQCSLPYPMSMKLSANTKFVQHTQSQSILYTYALQL